MFHVKHRGSHAAPSRRSAANLSEHACKPVYVDQPKGQTYVQGSLSVRLKNAPAHTALMMLPAP